MYILCYNVYMNISIEVTGDKYTSVKVPVGTSHKELKEAMEDVLRRAIPLNETIVVLPVVWSEERDCPSLMTIITGRITWGKIVDRSEDE